MKTYFQDIAIILESNGLNIPANIKAANDLIERRNAIKDIINRRTPNVGAGLPNGSTGLNDAFQEISNALAEIYAKDAQGKSWIGY